MWFQAQDEKTEATEEKETKEENGSSQEAEENVNQNATGLFHLSVSAFVFVFEVKSQSSKETCTFLTVFQLFVELNKI